MTGEPSDPENHGAKGLGTASELGFAKSLSYEGGRHGGAILRDFFFCDMFLNVYIRTDNLRYRKETLMPDDIDTLETKRSKLLEEVLSLGDLRPGSLTAVIRR